MISKDSVGKPRALVWETKDYLAMLFITAHLLSQDVNILAVDWSPGARMYTQGLVNARQVIYVLNIYTCLLQVDF